MPTKATHADEEDAAVAPYDELIPLEHAAWQALSTSGDAAAAFYETTLADNVLMLFPGGLVISDRTQVIDSMRGAPWSSFHLSGERVVPLTGRSAVVAYRATARRGDAEYTALFASTYVHEGEGWKLAVHQQTPI